MDPATRMGLKSIATIGASAGTGAGLFAAGVAVASNDDASGVLGSAVPSLLLKAAAITVAGAGMIRGFAHHADATIAGFRNSHGVETLDEMVASVSQTKRVYLSQFQRLLRSDDAILGAHNLQRIDVLQYALESYPRFKHSASSTRRFSRDLASYARKIPVEGNEEQVIKDTTVRLLRDINRRHLRGVSPYAAIYAVPDLAGVGKASAQIQLLKSLQKAKTNTVIALEQQYQNGSLRW